MLFMKARSTVASLVVVWAGAFMYSALLHQHVEDNHVDLVQSTRHLAPIFSISPSISPDLTTANEPNDQPQSRPSPVILKLKSNLGLEAYETPTFDASALAPAPAIAQASITSEASDPTTVIGNAAVHVSGKVVRSHRGEPASAPAPVIAQASIATKTSKASDPPTFVENAAVRVSEKTVRSHRGEPPTTNQTKCDKVVFDDGFAVIGNTFFRDFRRESLSLVRGGLCAAKKQCQASLQCAGFEWRPKTLEATMFSSLPPRGKWKHWESSISGSGSINSISKHPSETDPVRRRSGSSHHHRLRGPRRRRGLLALTSPALQRQLEKARARAQATASEGQQAAASAGEVGPALFVKVSVEGTLEHLLHRFDLRPRFQVRLNALEMAPPTMAGALLVGAASGMSQRNPSQQLSSSSAVAAAAPAVCSGMGLAGHPRALFDVFQVDGELQFKQGHTIDGGLCAAKAACAAISSCEGFLFKGRDGAGVLGSRFTVKKASPFRTSKKAPLTSYLYIRRPNTFESFDGQSFVSGQLKSRNLARGRSSSMVKLPAVHYSLLESPVETGTSCIEFGSFKNGSAPFTDPMRKSGDGGFMLAEEAGGLVEAFEPLTAATNSWGISRNQNERGSSREPVWISMTTLPGRIAQIQETVFSLLNQTVAPDELIINIPRQSDREGSRYVIPSWLQQLVDSEKSTSNVRLRHLEKDFGPATKLIPSVMEASERRENAVVLVVDDDTLYPPQLLETLLVWKKRLPDAALAFSGWPVHRTLKYPHWTENYLVYGNELLAPHPVSVIRGNTGYLVQTRFFNSSLWEGYASAPPGAFYMDDVWISGQLCMNHVKRFVVPFDEESFTSTPSGLENVVTLDSVALKTPHLVKQLLLEQEQQGPQRSSDVQQQEEIILKERVVPLRSTSFSSSFSSPRRALLAKSMPSTRATANTQALNHFAGYWDVLWDGRNFSIIPLS